jgi:pilus assembly protein Flp/PilA
MLRYYEKGQALVEYALILVLVSVVVIGALTVLGPTIGNVFSKINSTLVPLG